MLQNKRAIVFAATGAVSRGVARSFAEHGATVWLAGRDARVEALADELRSTIGDDARVHTAIVDATEEDAVADCVRRVRREGGSVDVVFNGIGGPPAELGYPKPTVELGVADFMIPIRRIVGSQFLTSREAGKVMVEQGSGAIVTLSATLSGSTAANMAGITAACGAVETMTRALAGDFGPHGVRVNCLRPSAMPETRTIQHTFAGLEAIRGSRPASPPPLGRMVTVSESAATAAFLASDAASGITGQVVTVCAGQFPGQG